MKIIFKMFVGIITIIPILIIAAILIVPRVVDPNDYRDRISQLVRDQTGRDFGIDGDLSVSVFPWVGVTARDTWLSQPEGFGDDNMVEVGEVDLRVKLLPLLERQVEVDTIVLLSPIVRISLQEDGRSSFDGLGGGDNPAEQAGAGDAAGAAAAIAVQGLQLENGTFIWDDRAAQQRYEIRELDVETGQLLSGNPGPVSVSGQFLDSAKPEPVRFAIDTIASLDIENLAVDAAAIDASIDQETMSLASSIETLRYEHTPGMLTVNGISATADTGEQAFEIMADNLGLDLNSQTLDLPGFSVTLPAGVLSGEVTGSQVFDSPVILGNASWEDSESGQRYDIRELQLTPGAVLRGETDTVTASGVLIDSASPEPLGFEFTGLVEIDSETTGIDIENAEISIDRGELELVSRMGSLRYAPDSSQININGLAATADTGEQVVIITAPELGLNLDAGDLDLPGFRVALPAGVLGGAVVGSQVFENPVILGEVSWEDGESGQRYEIRDLELSPGMVARGETDTVAASGMLIGGDSPDPLRFDLTGLVSIDAESSDIGINNADISIERGELDVVSRVENLLYEPEDGQLTINGLAATTALDQQPIRVNASSVALNLDTQDLEIPQLQLDLSPAVFSASISGTQIFDNPGLTGQLKADKFNLAELLRNLGMEYRPADPAAMSGASMSVLYEATPSSIELNGLVGLDESSLAGSFNLDNFDAPVISFDLSMNEIDLDRYVPAADSEDLSAGQPVHAGAALLLPIALFRDLNANGSFKADGLVSGGMRVRDIDVQVVSDENSITVTPRAYLYGGTLDGTISYLQQGTREELIIRESIDNVRLGELLSDTQVTDRVSGTGALDIDITVTESGGVQSSSGQIGFSARDGQLGSLNMQSLIQQATSLYYRAQGREPDPGAVSAGEGTEFTELNGTFVINDMVLVNDDLVMQAPGFRMDGRGEIDLNRGLLDYLASAAIVQSAEGQGGATRADLRAIPLPVRCSGAISDPTCSLDVGELTAQLAKQELKRRQGDIQEKILKEVGREVDLEGLLDILIK